MRMIDVIQKKRDGLELSPEEIDFLIEGYTKGDIPDYQMSAWAMAVYFQGMSARETADLTLAMARSGDQVDLSGIEGIKVDKHSTGGVADTTTLVLAPLAAAAGVKVAKMSGRGLGHTGGTIDKLESIPGFSTELTKDRFVKQVNDIGVAVISQSANIAPADKKLYALRDVTATVNSIPLIASSIMSKKIASGADKIVLDVKTGSGAFMKSLDASLQLAKAMVDIGTNVGRETVALVTHMDEPLGNAVGNALEVKEAFETLSGGGSSRLKELCLELGAQMLMLSNLAKSEKEAKGRLQELIDTGAALDKFGEFIAAQGAAGDIRTLPDRLPKADDMVPVQAETDGYVASIDAEEIGKAAMMLGAGRKTKEDSIELSVGLVMRKKVGDPVQRGEVLAELHVKKGMPDTVQECARKTKNAFAIRPERTQPAPLIYAVVTREGVRRYDNHNES